MYDTHSLFLFIYLNSRSKIPINEGHSSGYQQRETKASEYQIPAGGTLHRFGSQTKRPTHSLLDRSQAPRIAIVYMGRSEQVSRILTSFSFISHTLMAVVNVVIQSCQESLTVTSVRGSDPRVSERGQPPQTNFATYKTSHKMMSNGCFPFYCNTLA